MSQPTDTIYRYNVILDVVRANAEHGRSADGIKSDLLALVLDEPGRRLVEDAVHNVFAERSTA